MSLICWIGGSVWFSFPCVSGDEPVANNQKVTTEEFSPRERG